MRARLIYDGACIFCDAYVRLLSLREAVGPVKGDRQGRMASWRTLSPPRPKTSSPSTISCGHPLQESGAGAIRVAANGRTLPSMRPRQVRAWDQGGQGRAQMEAAVWPLVPL